MEPTTTDLSDVEIIDRVRGGERTLYAELIKRYHSRIRTVLSFYIHSQEELEEFLQASFVQAYLNLDNCNLNNGFYPWLRGIAVNTLKMEFRRVQATRKRTADYVRFVRLQRLESDPDGSHAEARATALRGCMEKLDSDEQALLQARYRDRTPLKQLTERLQSTENALKVRLLRLRNLLRACIHKHVAFLEEA
jgi:RNA polymerase sigma-70 factor (ECF subfamily)